MLTLVAVSVLVNFIVLALAFHFTGAEANRKNRLEEFLSNQKLKWKTKMAQPNSAAKRLKFLGELAAFLDACVLCLDAGLSLPFAFEEAATRLQSPETLDYARRVLRHYALGATFSQALENSKNSLTNDFFNEVGDALLVSLRLGSDISAALDGLAQQYRAQAKSQVEEMAARAPVKMLFPLVLFILPVIFILLGSGTIEQLLSSFSQM